MKIQDRIFLETAIVMAKDDNNRKDIESEINIKAIIANLIDKEGIVRKIHN